MPVYEGDGGVWLKRSTRMGKRVVPGSSRALLPADVRGVVGRVDAESVFSTQGRKSVRARGAVVEHAVGYKFTDSLSVVFRGTKALGLSDPFDIETAIMQVAAANPTDASYGDLARDIAYLEGTNQLSRLVKGMGSPEQSTAAVAMFRAVGVKALVRQNVDVGDFLSEGEAAVEKLGNMLEDLEGMDFDFL